MQDLLNQIKRGLDCNLYYLCLFVALAIPDVCGALESEDGLASKDKYINWFEKNVKTPESFLTGQDCYYFRCSMLHKGTTGHPKSSFKGIAFIEPGSTNNTVHNCNLSGMYCIDIGKFCTDIISAAYNWLESKSKDADFVKNYDKFVKRHPDGLAPYITGVSVIS